MYTSRADVMSTSRSPAPDAPAAGQFEPHASPRRVAQAHDAFLAFEARDEVWALEAHGHHYWHPIRYDVFGMVLQALGLMSDGRQGSGIGSVRDYVNVDPRRWLESARRASWRDVGPADLLVLNHPRQVRSGERWVCPYTDPLLAALPYRRWVLQDTHQGLHHHPVDTPGVKYFKAALNVRRLAVALRHGWRGSLLGRGERDRVRALIQELAQSFGIVVSARAVLNRIEWSLCTTMACQELFNRLLDRVRPRVVLEVVHYSYRCFPMTALARARNVPVVEIQHGTLGRTHLAYNLPRGRGREHFPDYLLTFSDFWRDTTPGLPLDASHAPAVGYAWLEDHLARARAGAPSRHAGPKVALFISQRSIGALLSRMAADLAHKVDPRAWRLRYKLHPGERDGWRERYPWLVDAPIEVVEDSTNIYDEFSRAHAQIGVYSTAVFEGIAFGLPTLIAACPGYETLAPLVDAGVATLCEDAQDLAQALHEAKPPAAELRERIWRSGARANFAAFLANLLPPR